MLLLWLNSILTLSLDSAWLVAAVLAVRRARGVPGAPARARALVTPSLRSLTALVVLHMLARTAYLRSLDGRIQRASTARTIDT